MKFTLFAQIIKVRTKILRRSAISPHNYTLKWYLLRGHSLGINDHEKFRLDLRNEKAISFNFHSSDFQENIFKASCMVTRSNLVNAENFCVVAHIKFFIKFIQSSLITSYSSRKLLKRILKSGKCW